MSLSVHRLTCPQQLAELASEWDELDQRSSPRSPFSSHTWNTLWWSHFHKSTVRCRDEFFVHLIRSDNGKLVAIAPLLKRHTPGFGPAHIRVIQFFGCDPSITELRGIICDPIDHADALKVLYDHFRFHERNWDLFLWSGVRENPACLPPQFKTQKMVETRVVSDYIIPMPSTWADLLSKVSSNTRKSFRKAAEFLKTDNHVYAFRVISDPAELNIAFDAFLRLHTARAQAYGMRVKHPDRFSSPITRAFMAEIVKTMALRGEIRLFQLEIGANTVASRSAFLLESTLYLYYSGFDPSWRRYAVMTTLSIKIMQWALANNVQVVNLSTGADLSKLRWKPVEIKFQEIAQSAPGVRGYLTVNLQKTMLISRATLNHLWGYRTGRPPAGSDRG